MGVAKGQLLKFLKGEQCGWAEMFNRTERLSAKNASGHEESF